MFDFLVRFWEKNDVRIEDVREKSCLVSVKNYIKLNHI